MERVRVILAPLSEEDREQFILDNQQAFRYGALEEFGLRDNSVGADGEIISRATIESSLDAVDSEAYRILLDGKKVGGIVLKIDDKTRHNHLDLFFISPEEHSKGIGSAAWKAVEALHPETLLWETCTPYFDKRNIHFYINKCGFQAVEFFCAFHSDPNEPLEGGGEGPSEMFRFEKIMGQR